MRNRFEPQTNCFIKPIEDTPVLKKSRDDTPALIQALLKIYTTPKYNTLIFEILENKILKGKAKTGRKGLDLWQIFVLAQFRLGLKLDFDRLHYMANSDATLRQLLGIESVDGQPKKQIGYQRILDNVHLLDDKTLIDINAVIVEFGHNEVFKKKEEQALCLKTDSFVVETNVHFPTDYNLLWDSARKALDTIDWFVKKHPTIEGWRKSDDWFKSLKNLSRSVGQASSLGGKLKRERVVSATKQYLTKATAFSDKLKVSKETLPNTTPEDAVMLLELDRFIELIDKHINLLERRILKEEKIPHHEKLFSIFEQYTEWITKGKKRPSVELGKKLSITTDQYGLIIDGYIMEKESDSQIVESTAERILKRFKVTSWSFDKGYYSKENKAYLQLLITQVIMPKKGKLNKEEYAQEHTSEFKEIRKHHSAIESNINELEHCGLDKCRDKGFHGFKRYVHIAITAFNLKRLGREILKQDREKLKEEKGVRLKASA